MRSGGGLLSAALEIPEVTSHPRTRGRPDVKNFTHRESNIAPAHAWAASNHGWSFTRHRNRTRARVGGLPSSEFPKMLPSTHPRTRGRPGGVSLRKSEVSYGNSIVTPNTPAVCAGWALWGDGGRGGRFSPVRRCGRLGADFHPQHMIPDQVFFSVTPTPPNWVLTKP